MLDKVWVPMIIFQLLVRACWRLNVMTEKTFCQTVSKGLGQLEAYIDAEEGVAFQMDNKLIWNCLGNSNEWAIQGMPEKKETSKFWVTRLPSGKVMMQDWTGMYLAPMPADADPDTYPLRPVPYPEDASFEVFYRDNKVAFRAYNGHFLARVNKGFHAIEAAKDAYDNRCCFQPMIGDLHIPTFRLLYVIKTDFPEDTGHRCVLMKDAALNLGPQAQSHTFSFTRKTTATDEIVWKHQWGLGIAQSRRIKIKGMPATLNYTENNEKKIYLSRKILEEHRKEVLIPPKSICHIQLSAMTYDNADFKFTAVIRKVKPNGGATIMRQRGSWTGLVYHDFVWVIEIKPCSFLD